MAGLKTGQVAGPLWIGPLHDRTFCQKVLDHVDANEDKFGTVPRMKGMVTLAKEVSFFFYLSLKSRGILSLNQPEGLLSGN